MKDMYGAQVAQKEKKAVDNEDELKTYRVDLTFTAIVEAVNESEAEEQAYDQIKGETADDIEIIEREGGD